ncbi:MAG: AAA family ATPase [Pseudothermotoga sp.]|nr:AAA family ATPase [Pseudothermotoga sp.]HCO98054.1 ATP-dependent protease [Pseudothermotoga sp.]
MPRFKTTEEIEPAHGFIGQEKARKAVDQALEIKEKGFNVFVVGLPGTGRRSFISSYLRQIAANMPTPRDWVYVYNFSNPSEPEAISLEAGRGKIFKQDMQQLADEVMEALEKIFESDEYAQRKSELEDEYMQKKTQLWEELKQKASELGFAVQITPTGVVTVPVYEGKLLTPDAFEALPDEVKQAFNENSRKLKLIVEGTLYKSRRLDREYKEKLMALDKDAALFTVGAMFEELKSQYESNPHIVRYLSNVQNDILENLAQLRGGDEDVRQAFKKRYSVNLIVDNSAVVGSPVVFERNPTYANLAGKVEYYSKGGMLFTDFTMIKPGAFHRANGGFLILEAENVLRYAYAWEYVKRCLMTDQIVVENLETALGLSSIVSLRPQPIPLNIKVFLICSPRLYYLLQMYDEDAEKLFRIKSEFDWEMDASRENIQKYLGFVASTCCRLNAPHLERQAVEKLMWYSARLAGNRNKLSMRLGEISSLVREACTVAVKKNSDVVRKEHMLEAIKQREERVNLLQTKYDEHIKNRDLMIETKGSRVGQINGLTVIDLHDHSFGVPVKITAKVHVGERGVIDIHREVDLSGNIHNKAVLTIEGFFRERYSRHVHFSLSATLSFEQVYSVVEGDSASVAEVLALISAIANVPLRQDIAVTGSMNQHGEVQPVGGVTEKVEGFYRACKLQGFTKTQGVVIPKANLKNLILKDEVLESIKKGEFHVWAVEHIDEAIELLTGKKAGRTTKSGTFEKGSVNYLVVQALKRAERIEEARKSRRRKKNR